MINSNELRIGNIVDAINKRYNEKYIIVESVNSECINSDWRPYNFIQLTPIPLTPEVLLAAGFTMEDKRQSKQHTNFFSMWVIDYKYSFAYADFRGDWGFYHSYTDAGKDENNNRFDFISCGIKYLHQLQNLYFALTGTELEIDLTKAIK